MLGLSAILIFEAIRTSLSGGLLTGVRPVCAALALAAVFKMLYEALILRHVRKYAPYHPLKKSALLMVRELVVATNLRFLFGTLGGLILPFMLLGAGTTGDVALVFALASGAFLLLSELLERYLFFRAVVALKMPGGSAA